VAITNTLPLKATTVTAQPTWNPPMVLARGHS